MFTSFPQSTGKGVNERGIVGGKGCASNFTFVGLENKSCSLCSSVSECERERERDYWSKMEGGWSLGKRASESESAHSKCAAYGTWMLLLLMPHLLCGALLHRWLLLFNVLEHKIVDRDFGLSK